jgi:F-type H+-transporting ATPase subunit epsilon
VYHLFIATPDGVIFNDEVQSLIAPGTVGYFEILTNHAPFLSTLKTGKLTVTDKDKKVWVWALTEGYFEMSKNQATLLAEAVELASEIDIKRAEEALVRTRKRTASKNKEIDLDRVKQAVERAENRLKIAREVQRKH